MGDGKGDNRQGFSGKHVRGDNRQSGSGSEKSLTSISKSRYPTVRTRVVVKTPPQSANERDVRRRLRKLKYDFNSANEDLVKLDFAAKLEKARKEVGNIMGLMSDIMECKGDIPKQLKKDLAYHQEKIGSYVTRYQDILDLKQSIKDKSFKLREELRLIFNSYKGVTQEFDVDLDEDFFSD
uniref:Uncharacterized protein n=1 Tax=Panagrolaimus superbus TaxID=310955 RepID=A0A914YT95_9BILA